MKYISFLLAVCTITLVSCTKSNVSSNTNNNGNNNNNCPTTYSTSLTSNSPVIVGWPLELTTNDDMSYLFNWAGPNGFSIDYSYYASNAGEQGIAVTSFADSGVYTVQLLTPDGCVAYEGTTDVQIVPAPSAPCNLPENSSISNVIGVGGLTYDGVTFNGNAISGYNSASQETLYFNFNGSSLPTPGVYTTSGYYAMNDTTVGCYFDDFPDDFLLNNGLVYVTSVNGKLQVSFCNCSVSNPLGGVQIYASASLTQP